MSQQLRKDGDVWMIGKESLARRIATLAMIASGQDAHNDFKTRDKIISAICTEIDSAIEVAIKIDSRGSVYLETFSLSKSKAVISPSLLLKNDIWYKVQPIKEAGE